MSDSASTIARPEFCMARGRMPAVAAVLPVEARLARRFSVCSRCKRWRNNQQPSSVGAERGKAGLHDLLRVAGFGFSNNDWDMGDSERPPFQNKQLTIAPHSEDFVVASSRNERRCQQCIFLVGHSRARRADTKHVEAINY